jgi:hypothetical protein
MTLAEQSLVLQLQTMVGSVSTVWKPAELVPVSTVWRLAELASTVR